MTSLIKLFYDLSCQDLPPVFEDHITIISGLLHKYLIYDNPSLRTTDDTESGPQEYIRAGIFEALMLYIQKYEDVFGPHLGQFIESTWSFLMTVGLETKYDILVSKALQFSYLCCFHPACREFQQSDRASPGYRKGYSTLILHFASLMWSFSRTSLSNSFEETWKDLTMIPADVLPPTSFVN